MKKIPFLKIDEGALAPRKAHDGDAAFDLHSIVDVRIPINTTVVIGTGIAFELPDDVFALVMSRSGLAAKSGVFVLNSPGLIDSGYRGEIKVILHNVSKKDFVVSKGDRIAQVLFQNSFPVSLLETRVLAESDRGDYGLGSTGMESFDDDIPMSPV